MRTMVLASLLWLAIAPGSAVAQVKAHLPANITPPWSKGIQPISRESYWNAMSCGKQPGARPACVFYDAELCANDEFTLAFYTPYKQVAYTVWRAVSRKQPPPTPSYADAQRMRIIIGVRPKHAAQNPVTGLTTTTFQDVHPRTAQVNVSAGLPGLKVNVNGSPVDTPHNEQPMELPPLTRCRRAGSVAQSAAGDRTPRTGWSIR